MFFRIKNWFAQKIVPMFMRVAMSTRIDDGLYQVDLDIFNAAHNAEEWTSRLAMLKDRKARLLKMRNELDNTDQITIRIDHSKVLKGLRETISVQQGADRVQQNGT